MNIREFKEGDIITRNEPCVYSHNGLMDSSYCGQMLVFVGLDETSKTIVLNLEGDSNPYVLSYAREKWDEGWAFYPVKLLDKARSYFKKVNTDKNL